MGDAADIAIDQSLQECPLCGGLVCICDEQGEELGGEDGTE